MEKRYSSFTEIDELLRILRLQREIDKESIKFNLHNVKTNFYPTQLVGGVSGLVQKIALTFAIKTLPNFSGVLKSFRRRERAESLE